MYICPNAGTMSSRLNRARAASFVRTRAKRSSDKGMSESVEIKSGRLLDSPSAGSTELNSLQSPRAAAENHHARWGSCVERGFK